MDAKILSPENLCTMVVEQTKRHPMRMRYCPETRAFVETSGESLGHKRGFLFPYGWVKESGTPPDAHWDVILMSEGEFSLGDEARVRVIGVFLRGDGDHKLVAVEEGRDVRDLFQLSPEELDSLRRLYPRVGPGEGWFGRDAAREVTETCEKPR